MRQIEPTQSIAAEVRRFILENFLFGQDDQGLENDASLLDNGIMDSTGVLELVSYLEQHFRIKVEDIELVPENLDSVNRLTDFIQRKQQA